MSRTHSNRSIKSLAIAEYKAGIKVSDISSKYSIGQSTIYNWIQSAKIERRNTLTTQAQRDEVITLYKSGFTAGYISNATGVPLSTCYALKHKVKQHSTGATAYSKQFKRNVVNSVHDGRSKHEVCSTYNITIDVLNTIIEDFRNGKLDDTPIAIKSQPAVQTMAVDALDKFTEVFKLLIGKGLDIDSSADVAKQLTAKMK